MQLAADQELQLANAVADFIDNPLGYVMFAFGWGEPGDLQEQEGPDEWQADILRLIGENSSNLDEALRIAVASGHGIGKTALVSWILHWFISTRPKCAGVVTANTKNQLVQKTWRELNLWNKRAIHGHWFDWSATKFALKSDPDTWFISAVPWSEHNSEAFAGLHAEHVIVIFDEASAVADAIWEVAEGAMTTPGAMWIAFGNPTKNTGRFRECFGRFRHRWKTRQIDSRTAKMANKKQIQAWVDDYGEDHDFVRVRVRGEFPNQAVTQFIPNDAVDNAVAREEDEHTILSPRVMGIDVARFGDDQSVILLREGNKISLIRRYRGLPIDQFSQHCAVAINEYKPDAIFVDGIGVGGGVVDILRAGQFKIDDVVSSASPLDPKVYANLRAEMWGKMRDWILQYAILPDDRELRDDLVNIEYGYNNHGAILLERKEDLKKRGLASPDIADALAMTFARPVASHEAQEMLTRRYMRATQTTNYATQSRIRRVNRR
ncbi:MAG: terminase [Pseudomonadota bacterium]